MNTIEAFYSFQELLLEELPYSFHSLSKELPYSFYDLLSKELSYSFQGLLLKLSQFSRTAIKGVVTVFKD